MNTASLSLVCSALGVSRARAEKWVSEGVIQPAPRPTNGLARGWSFPEAMRLGVLASMADMGLPLGAVREIEPQLHLYGFKNKEAFLVVSWVRGRIVPTRPRGVDGPQLTDLPRNGPFRYEAEVVDADRLVLLAHEPGVTPRLVIPLEPIEQLLLSMWPADLVIA